jgi:hypothetical protein
MNRNDLQRNPLFDTWVVLHTVKVLLTAAAAI